MIKKNLLYFGIFLATAVATSYSHINFNTADYNNLSFNSNFLFGCVHGKTGIQTPAHIEDDTIKLAKPLGMQAINFGIDWRLIEPREGQFDQKQLEQIKIKCQKLKQEGIKSFIYLYSGDAPEWFMHKGGFEYANNIFYFVRYCKKVFQALHADVAAWLTFYQPAGCALESYLRGTYPPYKKNMQLALDVLSNMLEAHVQVYQAIKGKLDQYGRRVGALPGAQSAQIGLSHHIYWLEPYHKINPFDQLAAYMGNRLNNKLVIEFFKTGQCKFTVPFAGNKFFFSAHVNHINPQAPHSIDFIGLIYHSHIFLKNFATVPNPKEIATDYEMFTVYPQGLHDTIEYVAQLRKPIHIMGNGVADAKDRLRENFLKQHLYVVSQAIAKGYTINSYFYRVLESEFRDQRKFGLYIQNSDGTHYLQPSAQYLIEVINQHKKRYGLLNEIKAN